MPLNAGVARAVELQSRCVMPAAAFNEWQVQPGGMKQPYYIQPAGDDEVLSIAALWDRSRMESGEDVLSCAIITMPAKELLSEIHKAKQRMPSQVARVGRYVLRGEPLDRPDFRQSGGRPIFAPGARRWSAGDARNPLRFIKL